jgi:hypothetical protein
MSIMHHEGGEWPVDGRGYASILLPDGFYMSAGKCEGPNLFGILGYIEGKGGFNVRNRNWADLKEGSSRHDVMLTWNSARDRGSNEFQNRFWTNAEGEWDFLDGHYDPTIGFAPVLAMYGEHALEMRFRQDDSGIGGGATFGYNADNKGNMFQAGIDYRHNFEGDDSVKGNFLVGTDVNGIGVFTGLTADLSDKNITAWVYVGKWFDL